MKKVRLKPEITSETAEDLRIYLEEFGRGVNRVSRGHGCAVIEMENPEDDLLVRRQFPELLVREIEIERPPGIPS